MGSIEQSMFKGAIKWETLSSKEDIRCVILGNDGVGKTGLLMTKLMGIFPNNILCILDNVISKVNVNGKQGTIDSWDTLEREDNNSAYRTRFYPHTDVIILCFSLASPISYDDVYRKWYPEVKECCPGSPIILVGTKRDLRSNPEVIESLKKENCAPITTADGLALAKMISSWNYVECSALEVKGVESVFIEATHAAG